MPHISDALSVLANIAPPGLAEEWDNVGLLVGDPSCALERLMTCLTITPDVVDEALSDDAQLVVSHHPLPFRPLRELTVGSTEGAMLWRLVGDRVAVYSPHTAYDSAPGGVNDQLADALGLSGSAPILPADDGAGGVGRMAEAPAGSTLGSLARSATLAFGIEHVRVVGPDNLSTMRVALACGSGGSLFDDAVRSGCDAIVTGEATFHDCLKCRSLGVGLVLLGHYASERFAVESLAQRLSQKLPGVTCWASRSETDPIRTL